MAWKTNRALASLLLRRSAGIANFIPCLNTHPLWVETLQNMAREFESGN